MKMYISGAITGLPVDVVRQMFDDAEMAVRWAGHEPVNPLFNGVDLDAPWEDHLAVDIANLLKCDAVVFLNNWQISRGARVELVVASESGKKMYVMVGKNSFSPVTNLKYQHLID
jgi:hypothetical protein